MKYPIGGSRTGCIACYARLYLMQMARLLGNTVQEDSRNHLSDISAGDLFEEIRFSMIRLSQRYANSSIQLQVFQRINEQSAT